jgi:hypothetical protein
VTDFTERQRFVTPDVRQAETVRLIRQERRRTVLCVCTHGGSAEDVLELLDVLGIDPREGLRELPPDVIAVPPVGVVRRSVAWNDPGKTNVRRGKK